MKQRKIARIALALAVVLALTMTELTPLSMVQDASAVTQADIDKLKDELSGMNSEKAQLEKELKSIQNNKNTALAQKENIDKQINILQSEIRNVESLISEYETLIEQTEQEIRANEEEEKRQYEKFCARVRSMEERGTVSYWSVLFNAASFTDLLSAMDFISEIMDSDQKVIDDLRALREQIEQTNAAIEKAQREYDLNKAAELKYGKLPQLQKQLAEEEKVAAAKKEDSLLRDRVTDEEIARIVARWTGIPVEKLVEGEREKLLHLDDVLHQRVIGQDEAVTKVSEAILRSRAGIANPNRPIGSFLFLGPTGVGKTELAKSLADCLFDDEHNLVRIDMTEYMEKHSVAKMIGSPPGYVGYDEAGQLTEKVRRQPYSVVLFDEIEKADRKVIHLFLQILDRGLLHNDFLDQDEDFSESIIIFTSNAGKALYEDGTSGDYTRMPKSVLLDAIRKDKNPYTGEQLFPEAICSRIASGNIIMFNHLKTRHLVKMIETQFAEVSRAVEQRLGYQITYDKDLSLLFLYHYGGLTDARIASAQGKNFLEREIFELSRQLGNQKALMDQVENVHFKINKKEMPAEILKLFVNEKRAKVLVMCTNEEFSYFNEVNKIAEMIRVSERKEAEKLLYTDVAMVLIDPYYGENKEHESGVSIDDMYSEGMSFFTELIESEINLPIYFIEFEKIFSVVDKNSLYQRGMAGIVPVNPLAPETVERQIDQILEEIFMEEKSREFAKRGYVLDFNTAQILSSDEKRLFIQYHDLKKRMAVDMDSQSAIMKDAQRPTTKFSEVIGAENAKTELAWFTEFLKNPKKYSMEGRRLPKGVLLYGPPGTGKTMLARAMAGESDVAFLETSATQFMNSYVGKSEENIRRLFRTARKYAPAIIFIDEIDAIAKERTGDTTSQHTESMLNTLLTEMDGFRENVKEPVFVLAATNYDLDGSVSGKKRRIDPALLRRFDNRIYVDLPNEEERKQYLELKLNQKGKNKISEDIISNLAARTTGQSIAILQNVIELAMRNAAKAGTELSGERLLDALEEYNYGEKKTWEQGYYESVAIHESGHAYAAWCAGEKPSYVTIVSRGNFGGYMQHENSENKPNYSREDLLGKIRTSLAGRAAEKVFFGREASLNTGASSDLRSATDMAMRVIATYGMDEENLVCLSPEQILNTTLAKEFIERTNRLLKEQMKETENLICSGREKVEALAKKLLEQNHLTQNEIQDIFDET